MAKIKLQEPAIPRHPLYYFQKNKNQLKTTRNYTIFIIILTILGFTIPITQAIDQNYIVLKNEYINIHPGQAIIPYPWEPTSPIKILPFDYTVPAIPGNNLSIRACKDEFESTSFIINAQKDLSGITISLPSLYDAQGNCIPADAINIRTVKVWYQADDDSIAWYTTPGYYLTPELLLKDDALVKVDYKNKINYLKVTINGSEQYIDISNPNGTFPSNAKIYDSKVLQPFSMAANENKQIWLTVRVPNNTPAGDYYGKIAITAPSEDPVIMNFSVTVLPFDLEPAPVDYGLYYTGILPSASSVAINPNIVAINSNIKTEAQYSLELKNMKEHGVLYPTLYQGLYQGDNKELDTVLKLRNAIGLPKDKIYIVNLNDIGNATDEAGLTTIANKVIDWRHHTETYGYIDTYFYGIDEAEGDILLSQIPAWQTVHKNGGKMFAASFKNSDLLDNVGYILDVGIVGTTINSTQAAMWHSYGHKIFLYNRPQVGIENSEIYRRNYGFALWNAGYDGAMDFAYQFKFGQSIWNDYDSGVRVQNIRDHVFAYPVSDGVIDTVQWEGFREGVDDTRYVATLMKKEGSNISARAIISAGLTNNEKMSTIRIKIIDQILLYQTTAFWSSLPSKL